MKEKMKLCLRSVCTWCHREPEGRGDLLQVLSMGDCFVAHAPRNDRRGFCKHVFISFSFLLVCLLFLVSPLHAAERLTLDEAIALAMKNNPELQASLQEVVISEAEKKQAGLPENPEVSTSFEFSDQHGSKVFPHITASQNVLDFYLASLRKKAASSQLEETKLHTANMSLALIANVKKAYYTLQAIDHFRGFLETIAQSAKTGAALSGRQFEAGNINQIELNAQKLIAEQAEIELIRSESELRMARAHLAELLGEPELATTLAIVKQLPSPRKEESSLPALEELALRNRLDLAVLRQQKTTLDHEYKLAKWHAFPSLELGVESEKETEGGTRLGPEIGLQLPLFDRGQGKKAKVRAQTHQNQYAITALENQIRTEVKESLARLIEAKAVALRYHHKILPLLSNTLDEAGKHYNFMLKGVFDLLHIRREQIAAHREYTEALRDYWIERAHLERVIGGTLKEEK